MPSVAATRERLRAAGIEPATLSTAEAAGYTGLSVGTFLAEVKAGTLPSPLPFKARRKLFSRAALDRALGSADAPRPDQVEQDISQAIDNYAV